MARSLGVSLAEAYPQVAALWLQDRNSGLPPEKATPKMQVEVWWRCAAGHEWQENISTRTALPKWKNGDIADCRHCVGYRVSHTYPECGHTAVVTPEAAAKKKPRCWKCYQQWCRQNEPRMKAELSAAAKADAGRAGELLDAGVPLSRDMPAPLAAEWRWWAAKYRQGAIAAEGGDRHGRAAAAVEGGRRAGGGQERGAAGAARRARTPLFARDPQAGHMVETG